MSFTVPNESKKVSRATISHDTSIPVGPIPTPSVDASESADFKSQEEEESQPSAWGEIGSCYKSPLLGSVTRKDSDAPCGDLCSRDGSGPLRQEVLLTEKLLTNGFITTPPTSGSTSPKSPREAHRYFSHRPRPLRCPLTRVLTNELKTTPPSRTRTSPKAIEAHRSFSHRPRPLRCPLTRVLTNELKTTPPSGTRTCSPKSPREAHRSFSQPQPTPSEMSSHSCTHQ